MKLVKSLLLGSAAGLVAVAGASAADLGVKKPTAVEYVKTCPTYGAGFFVVPGTTSCLRVAGRVRFEYLFGSQSSGGNDLVRGTDKNNFRARGYYILDHRTATEYGLLRTFIRGYFSRDNQNDGTSLEYAYIQFGGLTVGRKNALYDHGYGNNLIGSDQTGGFSDIAFVNGIEYTYNFGGGFTVTGAAESANEHRVALINTGYGGQAMPDFVGALTYTAAWGEIKGTAAVHQVRAANQIGGFADNPNTEYGWAVGIAGKVNLPFLAKGSYAWGNFSYGEGATRYQGYSAARQVGNQVLLFNDAILNPVNNRLELTRSWAFAGGVKLQFTPTIFGGVSGYYGEHDAFGANNTINTWLVAGTVGWEPVAGFGIYGEGVYRGFSASRGAGVNQIPVGVRVQRDDFQGRLRIQRDF